MLRRLSAGVNDTLSFVFPERRVILRSEKSNNYMRLSPLTQCFAAASAAAVIGFGGWLAADYGAASLRAATAADAQDTLQAQYEARIAMLEAERRRLADDLSEARGQTHLALSKLTDQHSSLSEAVAAEKELASALQTHRRKLDSLSGEHDETIQVCEATANRVTALEVDLHRLQSENRTLTGTIETLNQSLAAVADERDDASAHETQLTMRLEDLNAEIEQDAARRERLLEQLEEATTVSLGAMEEMLAKSGVDVEPLIDAVRREFSGQGGPFLPADEVEALSEEEGEVGRIAPLIGDMERLNLLRIAVDRMPLAQPAFGARRTSGFGTRKDPKNGRRAHHAGMDFAGPRGTPIFSTAAGEVVKAGRMSGYGNVIKIRHAFGYETVYAHLHRIRVKVGDMVERGDRIGDMGNTGRSTGTHLHYEIRIDGKPVNPARYIEAARHVL